jgi:hypothetical protein
METDTIETDARPTPPNPSLRRATVVPLGCRSAAPGGAVGSGIVMASCPARGRWAPDPLAAS